LNRLRPEQKYSEDKISPYFWPNGKISVRDGWRRMADNEFQDFYREFPVENHHGGRRDSRRTCIAFVGCC